MVRRSYGMRGGCCSNIDKSYKNKYIQEFNNILKKFCEDNNVYFIDIFKDFVKEDYKSLLEDGLHPNTKGHNKIFKAVRDFLVQKM